MSKSLLDSISLDELKSMYDAGMSCREIAESLGVSDKTVYRHLDGYTNRHGQGGRCAARIPKREYKKTEDKTYEAMAVSNSVNACLVVVEKSITVKGAVGEYLVEPGKRTVVANIQGALIDLDFDIIHGLVEGLKAIGRNMEAIGGNEMW